MRRVLPLTWLILLAPAGVPAQEPPAELLVRARTLLEQAPLIDTHNDLPSMLLEERGGDLTGLDLGAVQAGLSADVPRLRQGRVGAQYWSVYAPSSTMRTHNALHEALREFDVTLRAIRSRPELELADHIDHVRQLAGVDHVGIGSDFYDAGAGSMAVGLENVTRYPYLFAELLRRGYSDEDVLKIAGRNHLRAMRHMERVAAELQQSEPPLAAELPAGEAP